MNLPVIDDALLFEELKHKNYEGVFKELYVFAQKDYLKALLSKNAIEYNELSYLIDEAFMILIRKVQEDQIECSKNIGFRYFAGVLKMLLKKHFSKQDRLLLFPSDELFGEETTGKETFDFEVTREFETEDAVVLEFEGTKIKLIQDENFDGVSFDNPAFLAFSMDVDDFTDALVEFEEKEIPLVAGPAAEEGGEALFIADPDGYRIKLAYRE